MKGGGLQICMHVQHQPDLAHGPNGASHVRAPVQYVTFTTTRYVCVYSSSSKRAINLRLVKTEINLSVDSIALKIKRVFNNAN